MMYAGSNIKLNAKIARLSLCTAQRIKARKRVVGVNDNFLSQQCGIAMKEHGK